MTTTQVSVHGCALYTYTCSVPVDFLPPPPPPTHTHAYLHTCTYTHALQQLVVMASLNLAAKVKEMPVKLSDIVNTCHRSTHYSLPSSFLASVLLLPLSSLLHLSSSTVCSPHLLPSLSLFSLPLQMPPPE